MSEGDVSRIRDEDLLRRMWQQTEDFGRKKEIRAHMYRLREERLRSLYSPDPAPDTKGCEFTSAQKHVSSFADQTFQSMKSKEVRDAGSPPKEFTYRGQDLKELSNAGWNVESENRRTDDGRTHVKSVNANIEGQYDVEGGRGQFAAVDRQRKAVTEYQDDNTKLRRDETSSNTAAHEHVVRQTDDGTRISSTTSSSNTSSEFQQVSSSVHETAPRPIHDYDQHDTNPNEHVTRTTNTCDYEQNLRTNEFQSGELVSRKINYPDDNTKVIIETRCLPDGTRVTSTRREFHAPVQSTRSEYKTRSESKYNSQQQSDTRESSKVIRHTASNRTDDIVDSQRHVDDHDFRRQLREYVVDDDTTMETQSTNQRHETKANRKVSDHSQTTDDYQTSNETIRKRVVDESRNIRDAHHQTNQYFTDSVDQTDRREIIETFDNRNISQKDINVSHLVKDTEEIIHISPKTTSEPEYKTPRDVGEPSRNIPKTGREPGHNIPSVEPNQIFPKDTNEPHFQKVVNEQIHIVHKDRKTVDKKLEEVIERKSSSEHYQTTYHTDYQQKKVSNDWSPTHQAWASTLRGDTPSTTRPSTRASSPGSKTFKSSTSSLRSSVSPDKGFRKPSSRGGSPTKVDRCSPTRSVTSDRYSSTHSTHSTVESRTNKCTSPERKPPTGRSPTRSGESPDRKPQDHYRQRQTASPEKQPHNLANRFNTSPDRYSTKNTDYTTDNGSAFRPSVSPQRKPISDDSKPLFPRSSKSPDRKKPDGSLKKLEGSPEREVGYRQPTPTREPFNSPKRLSVSPDRKPGFMRPTVASQPTHDTRKPSKPADDLGSTDHKNIQSKVIEDHYKSITEETKTHSRTDKNHSVAHVKATSPSRKSPEKDISPSNGLPSPQKTKGRSPSPQKKKVMVSENDELYGRTDTTTKIDVINKYDKHTEDSIKRTPNETSKDNDTPSRDTSPTKFGTYDKKKQRDIPVSDVSPRDENSPNKKVSAPRSPTKQSPRNSTSPLKTQDAKYKYTTDFISTEKTTEEVNKKTVTKERPRQLVTPSASPTRQPKIETEPSTGQSSPTTSVSGFVYFGSPQTETVVTDLDDDFEAGTDYPVQSQSLTRPETLDVQRSQSPSKIPCRSPSPEKRDSSTADSLPRKSSLKKPSNYIAPVSPMEKPPSSFRISPTEDKPIEPEHKIVKKDNPDEPEVSTPMKTKPPLNRRETYEDRCRLILGMVDTATTENITKEIKQIKKKTESDKSSPDSPCDSPILRESSPFVNIPVQQKVSNIQTDVTDFISKEKDDLNKTAHDNNSNREPTLDSPTNLPKFKNEESKTLTITQVDTTQKRNKEGFSKTESKYESRRLNSPEKLNSCSIESPERQNRQKSQVGKPTSIVPNAESPEGIVHGNSPSRLPHPSISPERKQPVKENLDKNEQQKTGYKITSYEETITTENTEFDATDFLEEKTQVTKEKSPRTRVLESPNRQIPKSSDRVPSVESPSRPRVAETSPTRRNNSPDLHHNRESSHIKKQDRQHPEMSSPSEVRQSPQKVPGYMKNTTAISSKCENTSSTIDIEQTNTSKTVENKYKSVSPTSKHSQELPRSDHPAKPSQPNTKPHNEDSPERKLPKDTPIKLKPTDSTSNLPGYLKKTASTISKHDSSTTVSENISEHTTKKIVERKHSSGSPTRKVSQEPRTPSPSKFTRQPSVTSSPKKPDVSPERKPAYKQPSSPTKDKDSKRSKDNQTSERSPFRVTADKTLSSQNRTVDYETVEVVQGTITTKTNQKQHVTSRVSESPSRETPKRNESPRKKPEKDFPSPSDITRQSDDALMNNKHEITASVQTSHISEPHNIPSRTISPERKPSNKIPTKETTTKLTQNSTEKINPMRSSVSPEKKPSYMKPTASVISKLESMSTTVEPHTDVETTKTVDHMKHHSPSRQTPPRQSSVKPIKHNSDHHTEYEEPRQLRTPSPSKKTMKITEVSTDFLMSEREQEILDRVHKSLRKLSPERKEKSPSREKSPNKTTTSLQDLDITKTECIETHQLKTDITDTLDVHVMDKTSKTYLEKPKADKHKEQKIPIKPTLRNVSPIKKTPVTTTPSKVDKTLESPTKSRSISPRKQLSQTDRPQSPQTPRASGIRPKDQVPLIRKPTPATLSTYKIEKLAPDAKKTNGITKQNVTPKTTMTSKTTSRIVSPHTTKPSETETRRIPTPKSIKDNISPRKEPVTRTSSDGNIKSKKTSPQRMKSKPEIQVNDISPRSSKYLKTIIKEPYSKLPAKPKSATALNTSTDEDDVIVDVQQSKSSRENSPDRICPTPVNFADDVGTPRFPDEVSEPDDEYRRKSYHTIHETESVVDDIVEICEDEELFVKKTNTSTEYDDSLLSVNDKVNKYTNKISYVSNPKDTTTTFKDTERKVHSDFTNDNMESDECLLSVSEKVNKFAKGPRETRDSRSPSRKITDEYDKTTNYQDDYTKLSVNDKAHLFVETAENSKLPKLKMASKVDRPDLSNVDESLKKDDCLLSVSDKVSKFVKTAENYLTETQKVEQKERKIKEQHEKIIQQIVDEDEYDAEDTYAIDETTTKTFEKHVENSDNTPKPFNTETTTHSKVKDYSRPSVKPIDRTPIVKITTLRSSEAVKKAKALFENIASTQKPKDVTQTAKTTKLTDIGVVKKSPKTDSTIVLHPSVEDMSPNVTDVENEVDASPQAPHTTYQHPSGPLTRPHHSHVGEKSRSSPTPLTTQSPEVPRAKSPLRQNVETKSTKNILSRYPGAARSESPSHGSETQGRPEQKPEKVPGYLRPTKTSQIKEETKIVEETEVSTRRGSGKFGVELRRTSIERSTVSSERRRSVEHHQPCIEDIFDLDLLEQMLEKVVGYEQRRRIRSQIRVVKKETEHVDTYAYAKTKHTTTASKPKLPEQVLVKAPEHLPKSRTPQRTLSPQRQSKTLHSHPKEPATAVMNGHPKEIKTISSTHLRPQSPEKPGPKSIRPAKSPVRHLSPDKKRTVSPSKTIKLKENRFNEYASAYMKKVGLNEANKNKLADKKIKKATETKQTVSHETQDRTIQEFSTTKSLTERTSSRDVIEIVQVNGKRSPSPKKTTEKITGILRKPQSPDRMVKSPVSNVQSPEQRVQSPVSKVYISERRAHSPERKVYSPVSKVPDGRARSPEHKALSPERKPEHPDRRVISPDRKVTSPVERLHQRTPSPDFKRQKSDTKKETIIKTVYNIEKKIPTKPVQEEKPSWVTNRNLKKMTSDTRTFSSKKLETEKPKYRATSPSKVITKPIDVITSSYGPGPLDADGKPLFGIKALRNGASNFQVKGTVIRQEFHSRNGGEPEGTVSVTAYSSQPEELEQLMASQGAEPPSRIHGLSAITTTKKFGGDTGISMTSVNTKEERASLEQFTHTDRKMESHFDKIETCSFEPTEEVISDSRRIESRKSDRTDTSNKRREERVTEVRKEKKEERRDKVERREDKKTIRQSSVKSLTEKFIKSANDSGKTDRSTYPKAGLILRTTSTLRDSVSSDEAHPGLTRSDSEHSMGSVEDVVVRSTERGGTVTTTTRSSRHGPAHQRTSTSTSTVTHHQPTVTTTKKTTTVVTGSQEPVITKVVTQGPVTTKVVTSQRQGATVERSFLDSNTKVTGVQDILTRMKNADIVIEDGDTTEDSEARALLNKFLGATVLMAGMQNYVMEQPAGKMVVNQETVRTSTGGSKVTSVRSEDIDLDQCWDERLLRKLLDECTDYDQRRRLRARIRSLMAEQEACASAVTDALGAANITGEADGTGGGSEAREEEEVTVTSSVRRDSSEKTVSSSSTKSSKVTESVSRAAPKPVSPFAKFRQLEKQNSTNSPNSPKSPQSPGSPSQPYFKFTDPALQCSALTIKERLLQWCRDKTRDYENVKLENFSTSWADGLAFCALIHHFLPETFDYSKLTPERRRHNFTLAFKVADEKAGIYPLLDVDDMVAMRKPDWKCVFTYVQSIYRRFKDQA